MSKGQMLKWGKGRAMVFTNLGETMKLQEHTLPKLKSGEVLVRNEFATICGSDVHTFTGKRREKTPTVPGHEMVGYVEALPDGETVHTYDGQELSVGDRVSWSVMAFCGKCSNCLKGLPQKCIHLKKYGHEVITDEYFFSGGYADYTHLWKGTAIFKLSKQLPVKDQSWLNCAFATSMAAGRLAGSLKGKRVLIMGAGALGVLVIPIAKEQDAAAVEVVDPDQKRRAKALVFGADRVYGPDEFNAFSEDAEKYDVVIEMSGQHQAIKLGLARLGLGGILVFAGSVFKQPDISFNPEQLVRNLWQFKGLHNYLPEDLGKAVCFLEEYYGNYPFYLITSTKNFSLDNVNAAVEYAIHSDEFRVGISLA